MACWSSAPAPACGRVSSATEAVELLRLISRPWTPWTASLTATTMLQTAPACRHSHGCCRWVPTQCRSWHVAKHSCSCVGRLLRRQRRTSHLPRSGTSPGMRLPRSPATRWPTLESFPRMCRSALLARCFMARSIRTGACSTRCPCNCASLDASTHCPSGGVCIHSRCRRPSTHLQSRISRRTTGHLTGQLPPRDEPSWWPPWRGCGTPQRRSTSR